MLPKMDDYCKQQLGCSLEKCCAQYLEETKGLAPTMQMRAGTDAGKLIQHRTDSA